jgi:hypothetical protein
MKVADSFLSLKLETLQIIMALQDSAKLQRIRAVLEETEPTPQYLLDRIDRGRAESKAGLCTPAEGFLEGMKGW